MAIALIERLIRLLSSGPVPRRWWAATCRAIGLALLYGLALLALALVFFAR